MIPHVDTAEPVEAGESQVEHRDRGHQLADPLERGPAVLRLCNELEIGARADGARDAVPEERVVVSDQDGDAIGRHAPIAVLARSG